MKKTNSLQALWVICVILLSGLLFPACDTGDELDTNQYSGGIELNVFGPSPVARGGELRFLGSGMDQVTGVLIPGSAEITDIKVISDKEIRVTVPQTAEVGYVILHTPKGDITTKTKLTYSEPISLKSISPLSIKPGEVLTITGEYLNLMHEVIFTDGVIVAKDAFIKHQRDEIQVVVPAEAQSGKIVISDAAELPNWIYSDEELSVVLPSVDAVADLTGKKPGDLIEIAGKDLDLVKALRMPNGDEVEFEVKSAAEGEAISFVLPENMSDGAVVMVPASGVEVTIANIGMALPTEVVATPAAGLRAGDEIILTGVNMELITDITFPGVGEAVEPTSQTATEVKVAMPAAAISGNLLLNTGSGMSVEVPIETEKPEHTAYQSDAVSLGGDVVISGNHLDLVVKVAFTGGGEVEVSAESPTRLTVAMPTMNVETGVLTAYMANGESVEFPRLTINAPQFAYIPVLPGEDEVIKAGELFSIEIANQDKLAAVKVNDEDVKYIIAGDILYITIPRMAANQTKLTLVSSNGAIDYTVNVVPMGQIENVIYEGPLVLDWGTYTIAPDAFKEFTNGTVTLKISYQATGEGEGQIKFYDGHWQQILQSYNGGNEVYVLDPNQNEVELELSADELVACQTLTDWGQSMIFHGQNVILNSISAVYKQKLETTVWTGDVDLGSWSINYEMKPNTAFVDAGVKAGMKLRLYVKSNGDEPKIQLFNGHWERIYGDVVIEAVNTEVWSGDVITLPIDAAIAANLTEYIDWGYCLIVQGQDCVLKKVTIE